MLVRDFDYHLPDDRIAQEPAPRGESRLLVLDAEGAARHRRVADLPELLRPGDLLVVNDTRVIPARLYGRRIGEGEARHGARVEVLLVERVEGSPDEAPEWEALTRPGRKTRPGARLRFEGGPSTEPGGGSGGESRGGLTAEVLAKLGDGRHRLRFSEPVEPWLERLGHVPLPPYIKRPDRASDRARYQTVFAERPGAIAAPTAGLHFTPDLLARLGERGVPVARVTLHVGIGTFKPVTADLVHEHVMDRERYEVPEAAAAAVREARRRGGRVVAVGTTVVRTLESAARDDGTVAPGAGRTGLFIVPGFRFRVVDALLTNFHLPRSTLLMLVAAFAGRDRVLAAYREAIAEGYRFYSYGDAMLAERAGSSSWESGRGSRLCRIMPTADDTASPPATPDTEPRDFLRAIVAEDLASGKHASVATRFPPEPNGYLHIGHAKAIVLNFGVARENGGTCNLRFDDTNPLTEEMEYAEAIQEDVRWLGYDWDGLYFASDYFDQLYDRAERLVAKGLAYVDDLSEEEIREHRGTVTEPGRESPFRGRSPEENLDLFRRMRAGEFPDGSRVLRAKIDMASPNMKMRDPLLYRIRHADHYRTGSRWCIYPFYDFTHCLSDSFERITHSFCTLEFENNREIYDWILDALPEPEPHPRQIEFARLNLSFTVLSKRRLLTLVQEGHVEGWDDPRMPTLSGLRRRGVTPAAIRDFCERIGVARADNVVDVALLEHSIRDDLNTVAPRILCVLRPLKLIIEKYPESESEELDAPYFPHDVGKPGSRKVPFSRELWIERDDFAEEPPPGFHRLAPGREVRLRYGYFVRCTGVEKDPATGEVTAVRCTYDPETRGGAAPDGRKVKGTIHWVSAAHARDVEVRLCDRLFTAPRPAAGPEDFREHLNPESLVVLPDAKLEPAAASAEPGARFQFERQGYFYLDPEAVARGGRPVFNRIVTLRDTWARITERAEDAETAERGVVEPERPARRSARSEAPAAARPPRSPREGLEGEALARFDRYSAELGLAPEAARALAEDEDRARLFEEALAAERDVDPQALANWVVNELPRAAGDRPLAELPVTGRALAELVALAEDGILSSTAAREVLEELAARGGEPLEIVRRRGLEQVSDEVALAPVVEQVLSEHPDEAARFRAGEAKLQGFFVGRVMRATGGKANPELVNRLLRERPGAG